MNNPGEQFSRVLIDKELEYSGWNLLDQSQVRFELRGEAGRADYVLFGSTGPLCVVEAKNPRKDPYEAKEQAREYANELKAPFVVLSNGEAHWFWNLAKADELGVMEDDDRKIYVYLEMATGNEAEPSEEVSELAKRAVSMQKPLVELLDSSIEQGNQ